MVKNPEILKEFEDNYTREYSASISERFKIFDEMMQYAIKMGAFPRKDPLEGIETVIELARILHCGRRINKKNS